MTAQPIPIRSDPLPGAALAISAGVVELNFVSTLLQGEWVYPTIAGIVEAGDILSGDLRLVYETVEALALQGDTSHPSVVAHAMLANGKASQLTVLERNPAESLDERYQVLRQWLTLEVEEACPVAVGADYWAREVRRQAVLRRTGSAMHLLSMQAADAAAHADTDPRAVIADAMAQLAALAPSPRERPEYLLEEVRGDRESLDAVLDDPRTLSGFSSGLPSLDMPLNGWEAGRVVLIAARTSVGKSMLGLRVAQGLAAGSYVAVLYLSLEMSRRQIERRMLWSRSGVSLQTLRNQGHTTTEQRARIEDARAWLSSIPLLVDDSSGPDWADVRATIEQSAVKDNVGVVVIDHLDLLTNRRAARETRHLQLAAIMAACKEIAVKRNLCIVVLSQVNRATGGQQDAVPSLENLRESGSKEETADAVILLHRPAMGNTKIAADDPLHHELWAIIAKNRDGETGRRKLYVDVRLQRIEEFT